MTAEHSLTTIAHRLDGVACTVGELVAGLEDVKQTLSDTIQAMQMGFAKMEEQMDTRFDHMQGQIDMVINEMRQSNLRTNRLEVQTEIGRDTITDHEHRIGKLEDRKFRPI